MAVYLGDVKVAGRGSDGMDGRMTLNYIEGTTASSSIPIITDITGGTNTVGMLIRIHFVNAISTNSSGQILTVNGASNGVVVNGAPLSSINTLVVPAGEKRAFEFNGTNWVLLAGRPLFADVQGEVQTLNTINTTQQMIYSGTLMSSIPASNATWATIDLSSIIPTDGVYIAYINTRLTAVGVAAQSYAEIYARSLMMPNSIVMASVTAGTGASQTVRNTVLSAIPTNNRRIEIARDSTMANSNVGIYMWAYMVQRVG